MAARRRRVSEENRVLCGDFSSMDEEALLLRVLANLDPRDLFKLRLVCKSWCNAVLCPSFRQLYKPPAMDELWSALTIRAAGKQDNACERKLWRPLNNGSRLAEWSFPQLKGLCSSGGLVCGVLEHGSRSLVVVNPITRERSDLPPLSVRKPNVIGAFMETGADSSYKITVLLSHNEEYYEAIHYESATRSWHRGGVFTATKSMYSARYKTRPLVGSVCHYLVYDGDRYILAYDLMTESWSYDGLEYETPSVGPDGWRSELFSAFKYKDKYYVASLLTTSGGAAYYVTGAAIWEVDASAGINFLLQYVLVSEFRNADSGNPLEVLEDDVQHVNATLVGDTVFFFTAYKKYLWTSKYDHELRCLVAGCLQLQPG